MSAHTRTHHDETSLLDETALAERIFEHIDAGTTDLGDTVWREPVSHYLSQEPSRQSVR